MGMQGTTLFPQGLEPELNWGETARQKPRPFTEPSMKQALVLLVVRRLRRDYEAALPTNCATMRASRRIQNL